MNAAGGVRTWWLGHTRRWGAGVALVVFAGAALSGLVGRLLKHSAWLNDWNALICGASHAATGSALYGSAAECPNLNAAPYVYAPWAARVLAPLWNVLGGAGLDWAYAALLIPSLALLFWMGFARPLQGVDWRERIPFLALITGSALACGNISYPLHALIALAAVSLPRGRLFYIAAVAVACALKPQMATFLVVLLLEDRPVWRRSLTGAWAGVLCIGIAYFASAGAGAEHEAWITAIQTTVMEKLHQSVGFFGWWSYFGAPDNLPAMSVAFLLYAALLLGAAWIIAERSGMGARERVALGLGLAALTNPRLMDYDLVLLAPAPLLAVAALRSLHPRIADKLWIALLAGCVIALLLYVTGMHIAPPLFAVVILIAGARLLRPARQ